METMERVDPPQRLAPPVSVEASGERGEHEVLLVQTGEVYTCRERETLLEGMCRLGRRGIPVGCLGGGCGICKVRVVRGEVVRIGPISRAHISEEEEGQGYTLACRAAAKGSVTLEVVGKMQKAFFRGFTVQQDISRTKEGGASWES
jgi:3-phenylpropionate/trans-cinnamate dioxygenase ferredoxin reductase subunit